MRAGVADSAVAVPGVPFPPDVYRPKDKFSQCVLCSAPRWLKAAQALKAAQVVKTTQVVDRPPTWNW